MKTTIQTQNIDCDNCIKRDVCKYKEEFASVHNQILQTLATFANMTDGKIKGLEYLKPVRASCKFKYEMTSYIHSSDINHCSAINHYDSLRGGYDGDGE